MTVRTDALPELTQAWYTLEQLAASHGVQMGIADFGGFRTAADTSQILGYRDADYAVYVKQQRAAGKPVQSETSWRPISPYGSSYHDYGAARDFTVVIKPSSMSVDDAMALVRSLAPAAGLRAIYPGVDDPPHLELPIDLDTARQWWADYQAGTGHYATDATSSSSSSDDGTDDGSGSSDAGAGDTSSDDSSSSDDGSSDSTGMLLLALVAVTVFGITVAARRRLAQR